METMNKIIYIDICPVHGDGMATVSYKVYDDNSKYIETTYDYATPNWLKQNIDKIADEYFDQAFDMAKNVKFDGTESVELFVVEKENLIVVASVMFEFE